MKYNFKNNLILKIESKKNNKKAALQKIKF